MMMFVNLFLLLSIGNSMGYDIEEIIRSMKVTGTTHLGRIIEKLSINDLELIMKNLKGTQLTSLNFESNQIGDQGVITLAKYIKHSKITELNLSNNGIGPGGFEALAGVLNQTVIASLSIQNNKRMGDEGAGILAKGLIDARITYINLGECNVGDSGVEEIAKSLSRTMITRLHLSDNKIGNRGLSAIANVLNDTAIMYLSLSGNHIGPEGVEVIPMLNGTQLAWFPSDMFDKDKSAPQKAQIDTICLANMNRIKRLCKQFGAFVIIVDGSLKFNVEKMYDNKTEYINFAEVVADKKRIHGALFIGECPFDHTKNQILDFVGNIETRWSNCFDEANRRYKEFNSESSVFDLAQEFESLGNEKQSFCQRSSNPGIMQSIEERLCNSFYEVDYVYRVFENCVGLKDGSLSFNVDDAYTKRSEYIEFAGIVGKEKPDYMSRFKNRFKYSESQIRDFVGNIEIRLSECLRKTSLVYRAFISPFSNGRGAILTDFADEIVSNKKSYISYLVSRSLGFYSEDKVKEFIGNIRVTAPVG